MVSGSSQKLPNQNKNTNALYMCFYSIHWVVPPPSNSYHQDYSIFSRGSLYIPINLHLPLLLGGGTTQCIQYKQTPFLQCMMLEGSPFHTLPQLFLDNSQGPDYIEVIARCNFRERMVLVFHPGCFNYDQSWWFLYQSWWFQPILGELIQFD